MINSLNKSSYGNLKSHNSYLQIKSLQDLILNYSAMLFRQTARKSFFLLLRRYQMFHTATRRLERLRPGAVPLRSRKSAKSSEEKEGKHFVDFCRVTVKVK